MSFGKSFISAVLAESTVAGLLQYGPIDHLFKASELDAYTFIKSFVKQHGQLPQPETIESHTGQMLAKAVEPSSYYFEQMTKRHIDFELRQGMKSAEAMLLGEAPNPDAALVKITEVAMRLIASKFGKQVVDFREAYEMLWADYVSKNTLGEVGLHLGWPYFDKMSGGLNKGDMISYVGRPASGKTFQMLYGAHHGWQKAGNGGSPTSTPPACSSRWKWASCRSSSASPPCRRTCR
jgi:replicative DNA helicase